MGSYQNAFSQKSPTICIYMGLRFLLLSCPRSCPNICSIRNRFIFLRGYRSHWLLHLSPVSDLLWKTNPSNLGKHISLHDKPIFIHVWVYILPTFGWFFVVNVGKYTIHGFYGKKMIQYVWNSVEILKPPPHYCINFVSTCWRYLGVWGRFIFEQWTMKLESWNIICQNRSMRASIQSSAFDFMVYEKNCVGYHPLYTLNN